MANGNGNGDFKFTGGLRPLVLAGYFVAAAMSGMGGSYAWLKQVGPDIVRPDPFTGTQAAILDQRLQVVEAHIGPNHPDQTGSFDRRITIVETNQIIIMAQLERIISKLDTK